MKRSIVTALASVVLLFGALAHAIDRNFAVVNNTGAPISALHVSPHSSNNWGPDILGADVLADDATANVTFTPRVAAGECIFDLKIVDPAGAAHTVSSVNLCTTNSVTFLVQGGHVVFRAE